jgi:hypothetical protein
MGAITQSGVGAAQSKVTNYCAALINAVASLILALLVPTFVFWYRDVAAEHALGLTAVAGGMLESVFSLRFGIFFLVFFSCFYLARQSSKPWLRVALFWIPASLVTALGLALWAGFIHVMRLAASF